MSSRGREGVSGIVLTTVSVERESPVYEVAVVGAAGLIGGAVVRACGEAAIAALPLTLDRPLVLDGAVDDDARGVRTVVWSASRINPRMAAEHPELIAADLADLSRAIDALTALPTPPRLITFSSGGTVYGPPGVPPFKETDSVHPVNAYGEAKLAIEALLAASGLDTVVLRVANAYGPGQRAAHGQGVLAYWMESILAGEPVHLYGDPAATRDYVYIDDIATAVLAAQRAVAPPAIVNVGSGTATTLDHLLDALRPVVGPRSIHVVRHPPRPTDTLHSTLDSSLARTALGWEPSVSLADGVAAMWRWRIAHGGDA